LLVRMKTRQDAFNLLEEWVKSDSLRIHCFGVASVMEEYAKKNSLSDREADDWWICGLLHDFDWEKYPDICVHPKKGCEFLQREGYSEEIIQAILGHNPRLGFSRKSDMSKTLFAVDELSGLIIALAKVRPGNFEGMNSKSVKKAIKKKDFAAAVSREDINLGVEELGADRDIHFEIVILALSRVKDKLGF